MEIITMGLQVLAAALWVGALGWVLWQSYLVTEHAKIWRDKEREKEQKKCEGCGSCSCH